MHEVQVADHRAFGRAGGAGRIEDNGDLFLATVSGRRDLMVQHAGISGAANVDPVVEGGDRGLAVERRFGLAVDEHAGRAAMLDDVAQARAAFARTYRHRDRTEPGNSIHRDDDFDAIADVEDHPVPLRDSQFLKTRRQGAGLADDVVPGQALLFEDQCLVIASLGSCARDHVLER